MVDGNEHFPSWHFDAVLRFTARTSGRGSPFHSLGRAIHGTPARPTRPTAGDLCSRGHRSTSRWPAPSDSRARYVLHLHSPRSARRMHKQDGNVSSQRGVARIRLWRAVPKPHPAACVGRKSHRPRYAWRGRHQCSAAWAHGCGASAWRQAKAHLSWRKRAQCIAGHLVVSLRAAAVCFASTASAYCAATRTAVHLTRGLTLYRDFRGSQLFDGLNWFLVHAAEAQRDRAKPRQRTDCHSTDGLVASSERVSAVVDLTNCA